MDNIECGHPGAPGRRRWWPRFFSRWDSQSAMHAETSRAATVWRPRGLRHIVPWSRVRNHSGGQNVLLVFTVRVFLYDKHPRTLDPLGRSGEMTEPDRKGRSAP